MPRRFGYQRVALFPDRRHGQEKPKRPAQPTHALASVHHTARDRRGRPDLDSRVARIGSSREEQPWAWPGKTAIVTGAARGLGREYARAPGRGRRRGGGGRHRRLRRHRRRRRGRGRSRAGRDGRRDRRRQRPRHGRGGARPLRPHRHPRQQRRPLRRAARRPLRAARRRRMGPLHGRQREGPVALLQGGGAGDARGRRRQHHQHRIGRGPGRPALRAALHHVEGRGDRPDARPRPRARARRHPRQHGGAEHGDDRGHRGVLRRQGASAPPKSSAATRRCARTSRSRTSAARSSISPATTAPS